MSALPAYTRRGVPLPGPSSLPTESGQAATYDGLGTFVGWVTPGAGGVTDHGDLTGLGDDDHTQYAMLAGRAGGQTLVGGTGSGERLNLNTTSHATKGYISIDGAGEFGTGAKMVVQTSGLGLWVNGGSIRLTNITLSQGDSTNAALRASRFQCGTNGPVFDQSGPATLMVTPKDGVGYGMFRHRSENFTTAARPAAGSVGRVIYDSTLQKPLWDDGTNWRDAAGTIV